MQSQANLTNQEPVRNRLYGFDTLRAVATLLVVALHCGVPYVQSPMPGLLWPVREHASNIALDGLFWGTACFIMPLFFCMSGFFSHRQLEKVGTHKFLKNRRRRILVPLLIATAILLPAEIYLWVLGLIGQQRSTFHTLITLQFDEPENSLLWGLSHLWYLQYLFLYCLLYAWLYNRKLPLSSRLLEMCSQTRLLPFGIGFLSAAVLLYDPAALIGFQHAFLPVATKFLLNGLFFVTGIYLSRNREMLQQWQQNSLRYLLISALLTPVMLLAIQEYVAGNEQFSLRFTLAVVAGMFATLMTCGLIGLFQYQQQAAPRAVREMSESSYWVYLIHHPFAALCHVGFVSLGISAGGKFLLAFLVTNVFCRLTYTTLVQYSWLGKLLNGYRVARPQPTLQPATLSLPTVPALEIPAETKTAA